MSKTNLTDLLEKSKESDILNEEESVKVEQKIVPADEGEKETGFDEFQKQKMSYIEQALATVLNDMKQYDLNNSMKHKTSKNGIVHGNDDDNDYDEPPDDADDDDDNEDCLKHSSSNELLSTSTSTSPVFGDVIANRNTNEPRSLNATDSQHNLIMNKSRSDRPDLVIDLPLNERSKTPLYESLNSKHNDYVSTKMQTQSDWTNKSQIVVDGVSALAKKHSPNMPITSNDVKIDHQTSTPIRMQSFTRKTSPFESNTIENSHMMLVKKQPPPIIGKKPEKSDEILRRLNRTPSTSNTTKQIANSKATDV